MLTGIPSRLATSRGGRSSKNRSTTTLRDTTTGELHMIPNGDVGNISREALDAVPVPLGSPPAADGADAGS